MKNLISTLFLLLTVTLFSQMKFEPGYFMDNNNQRTDCLIKNSDWRYNPNDFIYKLSKGSESLKGNMENIKEFGIIGSSKYIRAEVEIDQSDEIAQRFSENPEPEFKKETVFLKTLVEGKGTLYRYFSINLRRYFYQKESGEIEQLVYKRYKKEDSNIGINNKYKNQLSRDLNCSPVKQKISKLAYEENDLVKFFKEYNNCEQSDVVVYDKNSKAIIHLHAFAGLNMNTFSFSIPNYPKQAEFIESKTTSFVPGLEFEYIFPFNRYKWAFITGAHYFNLKINETVPSDGVNGGLMTAKINYSAIGVPLGIRYFFHLSENSKIFFEPALYLLFKTNQSQLETFAADGSLHSQTDMKNGGISFGAGYRYDDRFGIIIRHFKNLPGIITSSKDNTFFQIGVSYAVF